MKESRLEFPIAVDDATSRLVLTCDEVKQCALQTWLPTFAPITFKTTSIPLPPKFIDYLMQDTMPLLLPDETEGDDIFLEDNEDKEDGDGAHREHDSNVEHDSHGDHYGDDDGDSGEQDDGVLESGNTSRGDPDGLEEDEGEEHVMESPRFPELMKTVQEALDRLGSGGSFVKLNWSAPQDAAWIMMDKTLKCRSATDVMLLLKTSDAIAYDVNCAYASCADATTRANIDDTSYYLHLRGWHDLHLSMEFRCFIKDGRMVAISQRHVHIYFPFLAEMADSIRDQLMAFHEGHVKGSFPLARYVIDVYVATESQTVLLVDFNPFHPVTDSKLFGWSELEMLASANAVPEFRCVRNSADVRPAPNHFHACPEDLLQLHRDTQQSSLERLLYDVLNREDHDLTNR